VGLQEQPLNVLAAEVTIAQGASLSGLIDTRGLPLVGVLMPATWDPADVTFQSSIDGTTFGNCFDREGNEIKLVNGAAVSRAFHIAPSVLPGVRFVKVRSGTTATPVSQGSARVLTLLFRLVE